MITDSTAKDDGRLRSPNRPKLPNHQIRLQLEMVATKAVQHVKDLDLRVQCHPGTAVSCTSLRPMKRCRLPFWGPGVQPTGGSACGRLSRRL